MNDLTRALMVFVFVILVFGSSYLSYDHIDNSYMMNEPEYLIELEATVDSLTATVKDQKEENKVLQREIDDLKPEGSEEASNE